MGGTPSLLEIHRRLLARDETAGDALADRLLEPLQRKLRERDEANAFDAVIDALFNLIKRPETFDPAKGQIEAFLLNAARFNLSNLRLSDGRRRRRETTAAHLQKNNVELPPPAGKLSMKADDAAHQRLLAALNPADWPVAELQRRKERRTNVFADAMGLGDRPVDEQRRAVKRAKDRVDKTRLRLKG